MGRNSDGRSMTQRNDVVANFNNPSFESSRARFRERFAGKKRELIARG